MVSWLRAAEPSESRLEGEQEVLCVRNRGGVLAGSGTSVRECSVLLPRLGGRGTLGELGLGRGWSEGGRRRAACGGGAERASGGCGDGAGGKLT